jgi:CheY-like chemotaxis protein
MPVLLLSGDLATASKVVAAAARQSVTLDVAPSVDALLEKVAAGQADLVILDLSTAGLDARTVVEQLRELSNAPRAIVAFGPHVHEALLAAAKDAGCDRVLSRGQFHAQVDSLLTALGRG